MCCGSGTADRAPLVKCLPGMTEGLGSVSTPHKADIVHRPVILVPDRQRQEDQEAKPKVILSCIISPSLACPKRRKRVVYELFPNQANLLFVILSYAAPMPSGKMRFTHCDPVIAVSKVELKNGGKAMARPSAFHHGSEGPHEAASPAGALQESTCCGRESCSSVA